MPRQCVAWPTRAPQQSPQRVGVAPLSASDPAALPNAQARLRNDSNRGFNALYDAQNGNEGHYHLPADQGAQSEDCLYLNVWTPHPARMPGRGLPVLFYIHGGAYNNGTVNADLYDGARLARQGVVVVTVNHRLNAFGYLELGELAGPAYRESGNVGMLDLVLALKWVRENVAAFGGDAGRVLIFGQSGGGAKCATLMAMESARGLFHRVLTMSGRRSGACRSARLPPTQKAALAAMDVTGPVTGEVTPAMLEALTMEQIQAGASTTGNWLPVVDNAVLLREQFDPDAPGMSAAVPMMLGNTRDEVMGLTAWLQAGLTWDTLPGELGTQLAVFKGPYQVE